MSDVPERLVHLTREDAVESILAEGLGPISYFCADIEGCLRFLHWRMQPNTVMTEVWVETQDLADAGLEVEVSTDHDPRLGDAWVVEGQIPTDLLELPGDGFNIGTVAWW